MNRALKTGHGWMQTRSLFKMMGLVGALCANAAPAFAQIAAYDLQYLEVPPDGVKAHG